MDITLINPKQIGTERKEEQKENILRGNLLWHPLGFLYISSVLKENHNVNFIDLNFEKIKGIDDIVGVSFDGIIGKKFTGKLRELKQDGKFIIAGGYDATFNFSKILKEGLADVVVLGEAEESIQKIIDDKWKKAEGIAYKNGNKIIVNNPAIIKDLNSFPPPDRELIDIEKYKKYNKWVNIITSRGCPNNCAFCKKFNQSYRVLSIEKVVEDMQILYDRGYRHFFFADNRFAFFKDRVMKLSAIIQKYFSDVTWHCLMHISDCDEDLLKIMKTSGCDNICIGIESFNQKTLDAINKGFNIKQLERVFKICEIIGIGISINMILGLPYESPELFLRNLKKYSKKLRPNWINVNILDASFDSNQLYNFGSPFQKNPEKFSLTFSGNNGFKNIESIRNIRFSSYEKMFPYVLSYCSEYNKGEFR